VHIDAGSRDEYNMHFGARILHRLLAARGIPHEHEEFDDGHRSLQYRYDISLPKLARALATEP
jgi:enterochelin esterase family protein